MFREIVHLLRNLSLKNDKIFQISGVKAGNIIMLRDTAFRFRAQLNLY